MTWILIMQLISYNGGAAIQYIEFSSEQSCVEAMAKQPKGEIAESATRRGWASATCAKKGRK